jgi:hypothetical protein
LLLKLRPGIYVIFIYRIIAQFHKIFKIYFFFILGYDIFPIIFYIKYLFWYNYKYFNCRDLHKIIISILGYEIIRDISIIYHLKFWIFDNFSYKWDLMEILFHSYPRDPYIILERSLLNKNVEILITEILIKSLQKGPYIRNL